MQSTSHVRRQTARYPAAWPPSSGECLQTLEGHGGAVSSVAFSHDSSRLASASYDTTVKIWDASSGECLQTLDIGRALFRISFDITDSYPQTDIGTIEVSALQYQVRDPFYPIRNLSVLNVMA
jgi:WD40 repeat protein